MAISVDLSNYSGEIGAQQARDLWAAGVRKVIVQIVNERILTHRQQLPVLIAQGFEMEAYVYVWFSGGEQFVRDRDAWACRELAAFPTVSMLWLDCEQSPEDDPPFDHVNEPTTDIIRAAVDVVTRAGYRTGIYTARWWWEPGTDNSTAFSHLPLWSANYDLDPDRDPANYGGWGVPDMEQYQHDVTLAGVPNIGLNVYEPDVSPVTPTPPVSEIAPIVTPLPGGEFLPEPDPDIVPAALWRAIKYPNSFADVRVTNVPAAPGWDAWKVEVRER